MADFLQRKQELVNAVRELDDGKVLQLAEEALRLGVEPLVLLEAVNEGMLAVGQLYEDKTYFIADLIMAANFCEVLGLEEIQTVQTQRLKRIGKLVLGTVH